MAFIREHGILDAGDHLLHKPAKVSADADVFFREAADLLRTLAPYVTSEIIATLPTQHGRWHPTGFMVFPLGTHPVYGTLRLHVWPAGLRQRVIQGRGCLGEIYDGDIHNHAWHITSLVLTSYYDNIYSVSDMPDGEKEPDESEIFRKFSVTYLPGSRQALVTNGTQVVARPTERRVINSGEIHTIKADVFHAPVIPTDTAGATLVFSSPRVQATGPDVLIGGTGEAVQDARREITSKEAHEARDQLRSLGVE